MLPEALACTGDSSVSNYELSDFFNVSRPLLACSCLLSRPAIGPPGIVVRQARHALAGEVDGVPFLSGLGSKMFQHHPGYFSKTSRSRGFTEDQTIDIRLGLLSCLNNRLVMSDWFRVTLKHSESNVTALWQDLQYHRPSSCEGYS